VLSGISTASVCSFGYSNTELPTHAQQMYALTGILLQLDYGFIFVSQRHVCLPRDVNRRSAFLPDQIPLVQGQIAMKAPFRSERWHGTYAVPLSFNVNAGRDPSCIALDDYYSGF
jgi:hypothetical protein